MSKTKTSVFFIATRGKNKPINVHFYTRGGKSVEFDDVKKEKTKKGFNFFTYNETVKAKKK